MGKHTLAPWQPMHYIHGSGHAVPVFELPTIDLMQVACLATSAIDRAMATSGAVSAHKNSEGRS